jgi:hypothetical protein
MGRRGQTKKQRKRDLYGITYIAERDDVDRIQTQQTVNGINAYLQALGQRLPNILDHGMLFN